MVREACLWHAVLVAVTAARGHEGLWVAQLVTLPR